MTAGILAELGIFTGSTVPGGMSNPKGFFENIEIREGVIKGILKAGNFCPLGVMSLPPENFDKKVLFGDGIQLKDILQKIISMQGYSNNLPWLYKDPKLTLVWRLFDAQFPNAFWIVARRNRQNFVRSCLRTHFMVKHSNEEEFWHNFADLYEIRLDQLIQTVGRVIQINTDDLVQGNYKPFQDVCDTVGIVFSKEKLDQFISIKHWNR